MKIMFQWQKFSRLFLIPILLMACLILLGCRQSPQTVYVPITPPPTTTSSYTSPPYTLPPTTTTPPAPITPTTTSRQWTWVPSSGNIVTGGAYAYVPLNGTYIQAGRTLILSWSADGNVEGFIFTGNQYNNFKQQLGVASAWIAHGSGVNGAISAYIQDSDTYYAVVRNTFTLGPSVKLYQAVLTEQ